MVIPEIMPGEIFWGYCERFRAINGFDHRSAATALCQRVLPSYAGGKRPPMVTLYARILGMSTQDLCQHYTTLPIDRAITDTYPGLRHGDPSTENVLRYKVSTNASGGWYCPACVSEDEGYWGYAFFRREHQLPGIVQCSKHTALLRWQQRRSDILYPGEDHSADSLRGLNPGTSDMQERLDDPCKDRYIKILEHWLMQTKPMPVDVFKSVINHRKKALGHDICVPWSRALLTLTERTMYVSASFAGTLLAGLFESAEDALNALSGQMAALSSHDEIFPQKASQNP